MKIVVAGIMAHNEEKSIANCIGSLLSQRFSSDGIRMEIWVVANCCSDGTEARVRAIAAEQSRVHLLSTDRKGKSHAVHLFKKHIQARYACGDRAQSVLGLLFVDADIRLASPDVVDTLASRLASSPGIHLVAPHGVPDLEAQPGRFSATRYIYRAKTNLRSILGGVSFSGMCYMIRPGIASRIEIPDFVMQEDRYIEEKLRGGIFEDWEVQFLIPLPDNLWVEIQRILRHSLANLQITHMYKDEGFTDSVISNPEMFGESPWSRKALIRGWTKLGLVDKLWIAVFCFFQLVGNLRARILIRRYGVKSVKFNQSFWTPQR